MSDFLATETEHSIQGPRLSRHERNKQLRGNVPEENLNQRPHIQLGHDSRGSSRPNRDDGQGNRLAKRPRMKAPTLRTSDWADKEDRIIELFEEQNKTVEDVKAIIEIEYVSQGFHATIRQYKSCLQRLGVGKNVRSTEMAAIVRKREHRRLLEPDKGELRFSVRGVEVSTVKIERWMHREARKKRTRKLDTHGPDRIEANSDPSDGPATPRAVRAWTASAPSSPKLHTTTSPRLAQRSQAGPDERLPSLSTNLRSQIPEPSYHVAGTMQYGNEQNGKDHDKAELGIRAVQRQILSSLWVSEVDLEDLAPLHKVFASRWASIAMAPTLEQKIWGLLYLAEANLDQGLYRTAEDQLRAALSAVEATHGQKHTVLSQVYRILGESLMRQGLYEQSKPFYEGAIEVALKHPDLANESVLIPSIGLAGVLQSQGECRKAEVLAEQVRSKAVRTPGLPLETTILINEIYAGILQAQQKFTEAAEALTSVHLFYTGLPGEEPRRLNFAHNMAQMAADMGQYDTAQTSFRNVLNVRKRVLGTKHPGTLESMHGLASVLMQQRTGASIRKADHFLQEAESLLEASSLISEEILGAKHPETLAGLRQLADVRFQQHRLDEANMLYERVNEGLSSRLGPSHPKTLACQREWSQVKTAIEVYLKMQQDMQLLQTDYQQFMLSAGPKLY